MGVGGTMIWGRLGVGRLLVLMSLCLLAGGLAAASAHAAAFATAPCPGPNVPYASEFRFPVAPEGFSPDCQIGFGSLSIDVRTGVPSINTRLTAAGSQVGLLVNAEGQIVQLRLPNGIFDFDRPAGGVAIVAAGGTTFSFTYNAAGRLAKIAASPSQTTTFAYDAAGHLVKLSQSGFSENFGYDAQGHVTSFSDSGSDTGSYTYSAAGQLTKAQTTITATDPTDTFTFDSVGVKSWSHTDMTTTTTAFLRDADGDVVAVKQGPVTVTALSYSSPHRPSTVTDGASTTIASFLYDSSGRLTTAQGMGGQSESFTYNAAGQLSSVADQTAKTTSLAYDALGRPVTITDPNLVATSIAYLPFPSAATGGAKSIKTVSATVTGQVNPHGVPTTYRFQFGKTKAYGHLTTVHAAGAGNAALAVSAALGSLSPGTTYHYRLLATSPGGTTNGADRTFRTAPLVCRVPRLIGDTLRRAKTKLAAAHCKLGQVTRPSHRPRHAHLVVGSQHPAPGKVRPQGTKVDVKLVVG